MEREINKLSEFFIILEEIGTKNYVFRGQNNPYSGIVASGFRPYKGRFNNDKFYNFRKISNDFKNKIIRKTSKDEKKHIYAFSQHHGIPTNLVDFTHSPLVALFFACHGKIERSFSLDQLVKKTSLEVLELLEKDNEFKEILIDSLKRVLKDKRETSYSEIYLIKKERLIDITDFVIDKEETNLVKLMRDEFFCKYLVDKIENVFDENTKYMYEWIENILKSYIDNDFDFFNFERYSHPENEKDRQLEVFLNSLKNTKEFSKEIEKLYNFVYINLLDKNIPFIDLFSKENQAHSSTSSIAARCYILLLINHLYLMKENNDWFNLNLDFYCSYQPPEIFDRIVNQKGMFITQTYIDNEDDIFPYQYLIKQRIIPDEIIKINNSNEILREIQYLGIDTGFIYNDIDNIAKSIVKEHLDALKEKLEE